MILGVGIDLLDVNRIEKLFGKFDSNRFAEKILSKREMELFSNIGDISKKINFIAKRFSSKESVLKAIGLGLGRGIGLTDISVLNDILGKPEISFNESSMRFLENFYNIDYKNIDFKMSVTDENNLVNTIVIISKRRC
ncbi:MAG: holo-ACP synthase [Rickettsiales bacterium]|nr:holo-ACP synthase [Rickettsiales bacterium]